MIPNLPLPIYFLRETDSVIDVTSMQSKIPQYEVSKGRIMMTESEKYVSSLKDDPDWEDHINKYVYGILETS